MINTGDLRSIVLTRWRPDKPTSGGGLRNWQNIRALAGKGPVDVISVGAEDAPELVDGVREWMPFTVRHRTPQERVKNRCWLFRPGVCPLVDRHHLKAARSWIEERLAADSYDIAVIETLSLSSYLDQFKRAGCRVIFDAHNAEAALRASIVEARADSRGWTWVGVKDGILQRRLKNAEARAVLGADVVWACSNHDAQQLQHAYGTPSQLTVVPNGIDVEAYRRPNVINPGADWSSVPMTLVYTGSFAYPPNAEAAMRLLDEVVPAIRKRGHRVRVVLVGRNPTPAMRSAAKRDAAVVVTGMVDSVLPFLEQPCIVTLPIVRGSGTRLKILEAFAVGRPVVSTRKGAEGLDAVNGEHLLIEDDSEAMACAVIELWSHLSVRRFLCARALELVRHRYSWATASDRIGQSIALLGNRTRPAGRSDVREVPA